MLQAALQKLQAEINAAQKPMKDILAYIGSFLMDRIRSHPDEAAQILAEGKTISGGYKAIENEAHKRKTGNMAFIPPEEGCNIVLKYYGITVPEEAPVVAPAPTISTSLDDLF